MAKLKFDGTGKRRFEMGVHECVLFVWDDAVAEGEDPWYGEGVAWNGITGITESPEGAEATDLWADNIKYASFRSAETFGATVEAYTYPDEFAACDGSAEPVTGMRIGQQKRKKFALAYKTGVGDDTNNEAGEILHLVYGLTASPSEKAYETVNDSPDAQTFSWDCDSDPIEVGTINGVKYKPTSVITVDQTKFTTGTSGTMAKFDALINKVYGTDPAQGSSTGGTAPEMPTPAEVYAALTT